MNGEYIKQNTDTSNNEARNNQVNNIQGNFRFDIDLLQNDEPINK